MSVWSPCRDDPYYFGLVCKVRGMDNQKQQPAFDTPYGMPTVFIIFNPIKPDKTTRVKKHHFCNIKADSVFCLIDSILRFIPFKNHGSSVSIPYNIVNIKNDL
jgi:hypothetical protein